MVYRALLSASAKSVGARNAPMVSHSSGSCIRAPSTPCSASGAIRGRSACIVLALQKRLDLGGGGQEGEVSLPGAAVLAEQEGAVQNVVEQALPELQAAITNDALAFELEVVGCADVLAVLVVQAEAARQVSTKDLVVQLADLLVGKLLGRGRRRGGDFY